MSDQTRTSRPLELDPVDQCPPGGRLFTLALQHVLVMYAGAIAVPLIVGGALKLPKDQIAFLINADLLCCGLVTIIQALGVGRFGIRLPIMMGVTFAAVGPMVAMAGNPALGINAILGAGIAAGLFGILFAPLVARALPLFPPVVTGSIIAVIGLSLMPVAINWSAGGQPRIRDAATGLMVDNPAYGAPEYLAIAAIVLVVVLAITRYGRGFLSNVAVLLGMGVGFAIAIALGKVSFDGLADVHWISVVTPLHFGMPVFDPISIATMCLVMVVVMVESLGMFLALGELTGRQLSRDDLTRGLRTDGLGTLIGGFLNTFPHTSFSQNVGLVGVTGVKSRWVCVAGGAILMAFGLFPKMALIIASVPQYVLGGAGLVMFGMVAATGIKILLAADLRNNRFNLYIVALSVGAGMIPMVAPKFFQQMPHALEPLLHSGILLAAITAVTLNLFLNGGRRSTTADAIEPALAH
ncbi:nucleobase:cation symporter-2 family protein [Thauera sp.]|uniref:nucleobase:cation symporter-2 family protein n=1 Tax=Thauera sp. TaxID=1905334 RepID=UPI001B4AF8D3|nr:nucleobase:cation symporter-2 family protein [Thauera sp.]MBP6132587.1 purine permease [Thauera sp.]MBP7048233.1 purine permease [Thauera sp.]